ncbi:MAG: hypothetical protein AAFU33_14030 [Bacteroidota bacterium]
MKILAKVFVLSTVLCFFSCSSEGQSQTTTTTEPETIAVETSSTIDPLKDPCEALSGADIVAINGFRASTDGTTNMASSDTWRICDFVVDKRNLSVSLKRYDDRIIETQGVERTYQKILETQDELSREEVKDAPGDQAIYTYGRKGPIFSYVLQWRYANHTEGMIAISYAKKQKAENVRQQLVSIATTLDKM